MEQSMSTTTKLIHVHCNECGHETNHELVSRVERRSSFDEGQYSVEVGTVWKTLQCRGCEEVSLHRLDWCSEDDPMDGPGPGTFFPPRVSRRKPTWADRFAMPDEYTGILDEIYVALHADSRRLAVMGARSLFDAYIQRNVGDQGSFAGGLKALQGKGLISEHNREVIEAALDVGHASAHRGHRPSNKAVNAVMDIVEHLIQSELLGDDAKSLRSSTPQRANAKKSAESD
jgi:hypothetical protein